MMTNVRLVQWQWNPNQVIETNVSAKLDGKKTGAHVLNSLPKRAVNMRTVHLWDQITLVGLTTSASSVHQGRYLSHEPTADV